MQDIHKYHDEDNYFPYVTEQLKVSKSNIRVRINVLFGQEGDTYVAYSPSLEVSGYGSTREEAKESFEINMEVFGDDLLAMSEYQQRSLLAELGWKKAKYRGKHQFSRAYVDENGELRNLTNVEVQPLEFA